MKEQWKVEIFAGRTIGWRTIHKDKSEDVYKKAEEVLRVEKLK